MWPVFAVREGPGMAGSFSQAGSFEVLPDSYGFSPILLHTCSWRGLRGRGTVVELGNLPQPLTSTLHGDR